MRGVATQTDPFAAWAAPLPPAAHEGIEAAIADYVASGMPEDAGPEQRLVEESRVRKLLDGTLLFQMRIDDADNRVLCPSETIDVRRLPQHCLEDSRFLKLLHRFASLQLGIEHYDFAWPLLPAARAARVADALRNADSPWLYQVSLGPAFLLPVPDVPDVPREAPPRMEPSQPAAMRSRAAPPPCVERVDESGGMSWTYTYEQGTLEFRRTCAAPDGAPVFHVMIGNGEPVPIEQGEMFFIMAVAANPGANTAFFRHELGDEFNALRTADRVNDKLGGRAVLVLRSGHGVSTGFRINADSLAPPGVRRPRARHGPSAARESIPTWNPRPFVLEGGLRCWKYEFAGNAHLSVERDEKKHWQIRVGTGLPARVPESVAVYVRAVAELGPVSSSTLRDVLQAKEPPRLNRVLNEKLLLTHPIVELIGNMHRVNPAALHPANARLAAPEKVTTAEMRVFLRNYSAENPDESLSREEMLFLMNRKDNDGNRATFRKFLERDRTRIEGEDTFRWVGDRAAAYDGDEDDDEEIGSGASSDSGSDSAAGAGAVVVTHVADGDIEMSEHAFTARRIQAEVLARLAEAPSRPDPAASRDAELLMTIGRGDFQREEGVRASSSSSSSSSSSGVRRPPPVGEAEPPAKKRHT